MVFNLFTLEGYFIARHLKVPCLAASPHLLNRWELTLAGGGEGSREGRSEMERTGSWYCLIPKKILVQPHTQENTRSASYPRYSLSLIPKIFAQPPHTQTSLFLPKSAFLISYRYHTVRDMHSQTLLPPSLPSFLRTPPVKFESHLAKTHPILHHQLKSALPGGTRSVLRVGVACLRMGVTCYCGRCGLLRGGGPLDVETLSERFWRGL